MIVQMARAFGATQVIAVDRGPEKLGAVRALGATDVVDASAMDAVESVLKLTGGRGVDVAFEALGRPETFVQAVEMTADGGRMVAVGIAPTGVTAPVEITRIVRRGIQIAGSYGARTRSDMPALLRLAARGAVDVDGLVTRRYALEEASEAYESLEQGRIVGRAVVCP